MAIGDRSKRIKDRVKLLTGVSNTQISDTMIYSLCDLYAKTIAEESLCIEKNVNLSVSSGVADVPNGLFRVKIVVMPSNIYQPVEVDVISYDEYSRINPSSAFVPKIYKRWVNASGANKITFFPNDTATYSIMYYSTPTTNIGDGIDPETTERYDGIYHYGVLGEILPLMGKIQEGIHYRSLFLSELENLKTRERKAKTVTNFIEFYDL